jgi:hypothetical protein
MRERIRYAFNHSATSPHWNRRNIHKSG